MLFRRFADIDRLYAHVALFQLSINIGGAFSVAFLLRQGLSPAVVFLAMAVILAMRFAVRPLVLFLVPRFGLRRTLMLGTSLDALQFLILPHVAGLDGAMVAFVMCLAIGEGIYWTSFHTAFAVIGEGSRLGHQIGLRQAIQTFVGVLGPPLGGILLVLFAPWVCFAVAAFVRLLAAAPLSRIGPLPGIDARAPKNAYKAARFGALIFLSDGWIINATTLAWGMAVFYALNQRFDALGWALAAAASVGAVAGFFLGRGIDQGHGRRAVGLNLAASLAVVGAQAFCGSAPSVVVAVMIFSALLGGFSVPALMTAVYAQAKLSPCSFRFQFAAEGGWDCGGALACLACAGLLALGASLQTTILLAAPMLVAQAYGLTPKYARPTDATPALTAPHP